MRDDWNSDGGISALSEIIALIEVGKGIKEFEKPDKECIYFSIITITRDDNPLYFIVITRWKWRRASIALEMKMQVVFKCIFLYIKVFIIHATLKGSGRFNK